MSLFFFSIFLIFSSNDKSFLELPGELPCSSQSLWPVQCWQIFLPKGILKPIHSPSQWVLSWRKQYQKPFAPLPSVRVALELFRKPFDGWSKDKFQIPWRNLQNGPNNVLTTQKIQLRLRLDRTWQKMKKGMWESLTHMYNPRTSAIWYSTSYSVSHLSAKRRNPLTSSIVTSGFPNTKLVEGISQGQAKVDVGGNLLKGPTVSVGICSGGLASPPVGAKGWATSGLASSPAGAKKWATEPNALAHFFLDNLSSAFIF